MITLSPTASEQFCRTTSFSQSVTGHSFNHHRQKCSTISLLCRNCFSVVLVSLLVNLSHMHVGSDLAWADQDNRDRHWDELAGVNLTELWLRLRLLREPDRLHCYKWMENIKLWQTHKICEFILVSPRNPEKLNFWSAFIWVFDFSIPNPDKLNYRPDFLGPEKQTQ